MRRKPKGILYRHFTKDGNLLYIGSTNDILERNAHHRACSKWFLDCSRIDIEHFNDRKSAYAAEIEAIKSELPIYNSMSKKNSLKVDEK